MQIGLAGHSGLMPTGLMPALGDSGGCSLHLNRSAEKYIPHPRQAQWFDGEDAAGEASGEPVPDIGASGLGPKFLAKYATRVSILSCGRRAPRSIIVSTVSCQSSAAFFAFVRFVSLWQSWQNSVAIAFPSPSGNSTAFGVSAGVAAGESDNGAAAGVDPAAGTAACGPKFLARY